MKERLRGFLGFLGLVEDDYSEFGPTPAARPFSEQSGDFEPEWQAPPTPAPARTFPTQPAAPTARPSSMPRPATNGAGPSVATPRPTSIAVLDANGARVRPLTNGSRAVSAFSPERDVAFIAPENFNNADRITDLLRSNRAVVLSTLDVDAELQRRLVDFAAGTTYALDAKMTILLRGVYLISPKGMQIGPEDKERLRATNFHALHQA